MVSIRILVNGKIGVNTMLAPALSYFVIAFAAGFALGVIRVLLLVPQLGARVAELAEAPVMLVVVFFTARWITTRFAVPPEWRLRLSIGALALACLLAVEFTVVLWLQGITLRDSFASRDPVSGAVYAVNLLLFALLPLFADRIPLGSCSAPTSKRGQK
jgi:hypothetical protein